MKKLITISPAITIDLDDVTAARRYQHEDPKLLLIRNLDGTESQQLRSPYWQYALQLKDERVASVFGEYVPERKEVIVTGHFVTDLEDIKDQFRSINSPGAQQELAELLDELMHPSDE